MTTAEINNVYQTLTNVKEKRLPVKLAFTLTKNLKKMESIVKSIEETRGELIRKYAEKDEHGEPKETNGRITVTPENTPAFNRDLTELLDTDNEITFERVPLSLVERCDEAEFDSLTLEEVYALGCMIED